MSRRARAGLDLPFDGRTRLPRGAEERARTRVQVRFGGIGVSDEAVELSLRAGDGPLAQDAPFAVQGKAAMSDDWRDLDDVVRLPGSWAVPLSANRFFRAVFRW